MDLIMLYIHVVHVLGWGLVQRRLFGNGCHSFRQINADGPVTVTMWVCSIYVCVRIHVLQRDSEGLGVNLGGGGCLYTIHVSS